MSQMSPTGEADGYVPSSGRPQYDEIRPLSVRMRDSVRSQLDVLAQLNDRSVTEETRLALEHWIERAKTDPTLKERADRVRAEIDRDAEQRRRSIERDAANQRHAIAAVLGVDDGQAPDELDSEASDDEEQTPGSESGEPSSAPEADETAEDARPPRRHASSEARRAEHLRRKRPGVETD